MTPRSELVLVLGATGQQGGSTARALVAEGWRVRALVRDPASAPAKALATLGVELSRGDLRDRASLERAVAGAEGVFSVQPSSLQGKYDITDEDELRFGVEVVDAAKRAGVKHVVYTSVAGAGPSVGVGHFESKWRIEEHLRQSGLVYTVLRPAPFMELLLEPLVGLASGRFQFFSAPEQDVQFIAVRDIGVFAARAFADPARYGGTSFEIAGDAIPCRAIADKISAASGRPIAYARFPAEATAASPALARLVELIDEGVITGHADIAALRRAWPELLTFDSWLEKGGADAIRRLTAP